MLDVVALFYNQRLHRYKQAALDLVLVLVKLIAL